MKRLFLALTPEPDDALSLWESWEIFRISSPHIRWLRSEQFHMTLLFFGDCEENQISLIADQMDQAVETFRSPVVETAGPGQFPSGGKPRVFVETLKDSSGSLTALQGKLYSCLRKDFPLESRKFLPHITMARLSRYPGHMIFHQRPALHFSVNQLILYESVLRREGAEYSTVYKSDLKG